MKLAVPRLEVGASLRRVLCSSMALGALVFAIGLCVDPERAWTSFLVALVYVTGLGLGAAFFISSQYVCGAGWSVGIRRIPEAMTSILPAAGAGALVLVFGLDRLRARTADAASAGAEVLGGKASWLGAPLLVPRLLGYFLLWIVLSRILVRTSRRQDADGDLLHTQRNVRNSVLFLLLGTWSFCLASVDLLMSLQPRWSSTIFGFLSLAGVFLTSLAAIAVFVVVFRRRGWNHLFTDEHLADLGRLLLAFSTFWVYLWVSQHLLIWYSNLPEETSYYVVRHAGSWGVLSAANVLLNWLVPFLLLLTHSGRSSDRTVLVAALSVLAGHWLDLYLVAAPPTLGSTPNIGLLELLPLAGAGALFVWVALRSLARENLVPIRDPRLVESLPELSR